MSVVVVLGQTFTEPLRAAGMVCDGPRSFGVMSHRAPSAKEAESNVSHNSPVRPGGSTVAPINPFPSPARWLRFLSLPCPEWAEVYPERVAPLLTAGLGGFGGFGPLPTARHAPIAQAGGRGTPCNRQAECERSSEE